MPATKKRVIPIKLVAATPVRKKKAKKKPAYDCRKCPGYCCSYPLIEVTKRDIARLAKHFGLTYEQAEKRYTRYDKAEKAIALRRQKDKLAGKITLLNVAAMPLIVILVGFILFLQRRRATRAR